jgi:hypothetical protein
MIKVGDFYMHDKALDVCVLVLEDHGSGTYEVQWYNMGYTGDAWMIDPVPQRIYMHPDVWTNITKHVNLPRVGDA